MKQALRLPSALTQAEEKDRAESCRALKRLRRKQNEKVTLHFTSLRPDM